MPPKAAQKPKAEPAKTPKQSPVKQSPAKESPAKPTTPRKPKEPVVYKTLQHDAGVPIQIDVTFEGQSELAKLTKSGGHTHTIKLQGSSAFSLVKTFMFTDGPYEGQQAILLRPAKAFPFLKLPKEARKRVYSFYFAPNGVVGNEIVVEGKRSSTKEMFAKSYADGLKNRVALLATNKEINQEATPLFYNQTIKLESTASLLEFLGQIESEVRPHLVNITLKAWVKTTARNAMRILADSPNIKTFHIDSGVFNEGDPAKAAKIFFDDSRKFLESIGAKKGDKEAGVDVIEFGPQALTLKGDDKNGFNKGAKPWPDTMVEEFKEELRAKLR